MFGFKARRKRRETTYFTNVYLGLAYQFLLERVPPKDLAERLVAASWNPSTLKPVGGRTVELGPLVHAAEALRLGYASFSATPEERAMSAHALSDLLSYGVDRKNAASVSSADRQILALMVNSMVADPAFANAQSFTTPVTARAYERLQNRLA